MSETAEFDERQWRRELAANREEKDEFFGTHPHSPIPKGERDAFDGLEYFEPDADYRVTATVHLTDEDDEDVYRMETSTGGEQRYLKVAALTFELDGEEHSLSAYRQEGEERESLFVPFRDKTTGQQTYGAGRYMELEAEGDLADGQEIPVDFNLAYNPFCAYAEQYACPLPPEENWLDATVEAGERDWD
ncbi:DUF1684 domain-containing protein [Halorubellus sp. JP-L1]|uniref:DUF1684 domain-containing protein n=1 Tax=Halorubellus sp. JP-L1 TaxID=2715753 RepID=UPI00140B3152|nr:DUF1684 domain-containing protein [Halorubellus sp. JP-L1]NHN43506.1 DUF1684 domain-containing protein [Halorubellus sp. JP-L1]